MGWPVRAVIIQLEIRWQWPSHPGLRSWKTNKSLSIIYDGTSGDEHSTVASSQVPPCLIRSSSLRRSDICVFVITPLSIFS